MKPEKYLAFFAFCVLALTAACGSCGMASALVFDQQENSAYSDALEHRMRKHLNRSVEYLNSFPQEQEIPVHQKSSCTGREVFSVFF